MCPSVRLVGEVLPATAGTHTTDKPCIPNMGVILDRWQLKAGGQLVDENLNTESNTMLKNLKGSGMTIIADNDTVAPLAALQPQDYQSLPYSRVNYNATSTTWSKFSVPLQVDESELFGPINQDQPKRTTVLLPLSKMPKAILSVYFKTTGGEVVTFCGASPADSVASYQLRNVRLEMQYVASPTLDRQLNAGGWSATFRSHQYTQFTVANTGAGSKISLQVPSSFNSVSHVMAKFRARDYSDARVENRHQLSSAGCSEISALNVRVNGQPRYPEDLDSQGALSELNKVSLSYLAMCVGVVGLLVFCFC